MIEADSVKRKNFTFLGSPYSRFLSRKFFFYLRLAWYRNCLSLRFGNSTAGYKLDPINFMLSYACSKKCELKSMSTANQSHFTPNVVIFLIQQPISCFLHSLREPLVLFMKNKGSIGCIRLRMILFV